MIAGRQFFSGPPPIYGARIFHREAGGGPSVCGGGDRTILGGQRGGREKIGDQ